MNASTAVPQLPNPLTPLAWLPPDTAIQLEASRYLYSATVGAWIWDFLMSIHEEYLLFTKRGVSLSDVVYVLARLASLAFITTCLVFQVAPVEDCHALAKAIGWCGAFALPLNSLLFFFRIRAVFSTSPIIQIFFFITWLGVFGGALTAPFGVDGVHIGTTKNCVNSNVKPYSSAGSFVVAINDTLVFIAISIRLLMYSLADTWAERFKVFFGGRGMGNMSKSLLQTGQLYYLATVGVNIVAVVVILTPSIPPVYRAMFSIPNVALQNAMACRVFRQIKLGLLNERPTTITPSQMETPIAFVPISRLKYNSGMTVTRGTTNEDHTSTFQSPSSYKSPIGPSTMRVEINRETQVTVDPDLHIPGRGGNMRDWKSPDIV